MQFIKKHILHIVILFSIIFTIINFYEKEDMLAQHGLAISIPNTSFIGPPSETLNYEAINEKGLIAKSGIKSINADDFFNAKSIIGLKALFENLSLYIASTGEIEKAAEIDLIAKNIKQTYVFRRPAHKYLVNNTLNNRIIFYGADNEFDHGPGHKDIDRLSHLIGLPLIKLMTHFNDAQGGSLDQLLEEGAGGMTHAGGYIPGWYKGKKVAVRSDWPADYGILNDDNVKYNAHIFAIDYQAGTKKNIPQSTLNNYHKNYALWDVFTGLNIPFVKKSKIIEYQDYKNNPLEVYNRETLNRLATITSSLDRSKVKFTSYCAEGQWNTMNLAPNILIKKGTYPKIDKFITAFQSAPLYSAMSIEQKKQHPEIGWQWLQEKQILNKEQVKNILTTRRNSIYLDWVDNDIQPWTKYNPQREDGLIADPMTIGTLARMLLRTYFPREEVAKAIEIELLNLYTTTKNVKVKEAITSLLEGFSPDSIIGGYALGKAAIKISGMQFVMLLHYDMFKNMIFNKLGYQHILSEDDKLKVDTLYEKYISAILNPELVNRKDFDKALAKIDYELSLLTVEMKVYGPNDTNLRSKTEKVKFFMWAPPQAWAFWAQYPKMFNSNSIKYAVTAMHYNQSIKFAESEINNP